MSAPSIDSQIANNLGALDDLRRQRVEAAAALDAVEHSLKLMEADLTALGAFYCNHHDSIAEADRERVRALLEAKGICV